MLHISHLCHDIFPPFKHEKALTNRGWAAVWTRLKVKGYWATFNGHEVKNVHAFIAHLCHNIFSPCKYEEAVAIMGQAATHIRLKVKGHWTTLKGHKVKYSWVLHTYCMTVSHHLNMRLWQIWIHPAAAQTRLEVKGIWVTFKGHEVNISCKRHTYTIISSYHLNRERLRQLGTEQLSGQSFVTNRPTDRPIDRPTDGRLPTYMSHKPFWVGRQK